MAQVALENRMNRIADTARWTEPGNRAHAFRMTLVSKDELPQLKAPAQFVHRVLASQQGL